MSNVMRITIYWPSTLLKYHSYLLKGDSCARWSVQWRKRSSFLKLFLANRSFDFFAIVIVEPLHPSSLGNHYIVVIYDRFSKVTRSVTFKGIISLTVAREYWRSSYGSRTYLLLDNGVQIASKIFKNTCHIIRIQNLFTTAYHAQTNSKVKGFNRTISASILHYVVEHQKAWNEF